MSKIGRKPIDLEGVQVTVNDQEIEIKGKNGTVKYWLPEALHAEIKDKKLFISCRDAIKQDSMLWGLHRALLANKIEGMKKGFERELTIVGLGYKGALSGGKIIFSLGYSHKIDFPLPKDITVEIDKTGQIIKVKGFDKQLVGSVCSEIKALRPPEPYKGTGIKLSDEVIMRKAGKTKAAA